MSEDQTGNPKKLYSFIKSKRCDASGVAPLSSNGTNHSDSVKKSNILNDQFTSVFTSEDKTSIPRLTPTDHPDAKPIVVNRKGVLKLLKDINPYKATGPDAIPGRLLKTLEGRKLLSPFPLLAKCTFIVKNPELYSKYKVSCSKIQHSVIVEARTGDPTISFQFKMKTADRLMYSSSTKGCF